MTGRTIGIMGRLLDQDDGLGVYSLYLLKEMFAQDRQTRYLIFLSSPKSKDLFKDLPNVQMCILRAPSKLLWDQVAVPLAARRLGAELIFNPKFSVPLLTRLPCVFVQQGSDWYANPGNYPWWDNIYIRLMLPMYSRKAVRTLAISQQTLDDLAKYTSIDTHRSVVSYAGIGPNFTAQRDEHALQRFREQYKLPDRYIFTVARVRHGGHTHLPEYPGGNNERLLRGYLQYRKNGGDLPFVVAGFEVEQYLRARGFTDAELKDVTFMGFVPNKQIHMGYQLATCFVLATLCESFGIPIVEAMATGCPAIVPTTGACPEIAAGSARLIDPFNEEDIATALLEVTRSEELRNSMRARGLKRAADFTWAETARRTLEVLHGVLESSKPRTLAGTGVGSPRT
jgi:glycosyltransferase involved in cell wall biosynthesis